MESKLNFFETVPKRTIVSLHSELALRVEAFLLLSVGWKLTVRLLCNGDYYMSMPNFPMRDLKRLFKVPVLIESTYFRVYV